MSTTTTIPAPLQDMQVPQANRYFTLALAELAECQQTLAMAALMPLSPAMASKLGDAALQADRAAARIRITLLGMEASVAPVAAGPAVSPAMLDAAEADFLRQRSSAGWEDEKDVAEGLDLESIIKAALAARNKETCA